jgi:hypothetical protein
LNILVLPLRRIPISRIRGTLDPAPRNGTSFDAGRALGSCSGAPGERKAGRACTADTPLRSVDVGGCSDRRRTCKLCSRHTHTHTHTHRFSNTRAALPDRSRPAMPCGIALCGAVTAASHSGKTRDSRQEMQAHTCREAVESRQRSLRSVVPASRAHPVAPQPAATPGERPSRAMTSPRWPAEETLGSSTRR